MAAPAEPRLRRLDRTGLPEATFNWSRTKRAREGNLGIL